MGDIYVTTNGPWLTTTASITTSNVVYFNGTSAPKPVERALPEAVAIPETPEQWLRRRVDEVCWRPAA